MKESLVEYSINETDDNFKYSSQSTELEQLTEQRTFTPHGYSHTHHVLNSFVFHQNCNISFVYFSNRKRERLFEPALSAFVEYNWIWLAIRIKATSEMIKNCVCAKKRWKAGIRSSISSMYVCITYVCKPNHVVLNNVRWNIIVTTPSHGTITITIVHSVLETWL